MVILFATFINIANKIITCMYISAFYIYLYMQALSCCKQNNSNLNVSTLKLSFYIKEELIFTKNNYSFFFSKDFFENLFKKSRDLKKFEYGQLREILNILL